MDKVACTLAFQDEHELMQYEEQASDNVGQEPEQAEQEDSLDSDQRAEQLRREDMLEYEIRRLEQLN